MNIDKDLEIVKTKIEYYKNNPEGCNWRLSFEDTEDIQAIENVLSELEKKDKIIDLMSRAILNYDDQLVINKYRNKEEVKEYFEENYEELMKRYDR